MANPLGTLHQIRKNNKWELSVNSWLTILFAALLLGSIWFFVWQQINNDYDRTFAESYRETMNLAKAFEENIRSVISDADRDSLTLKQAYERDSGDTAFFEKYMAHLRQDPTRSIVLVLDEQGWIIVNSMQNIGPTNFSYRDYFKFHRDTHNNQLDIGKPILGALTKQNIIPLTRRINKPDGSFGGLVYIGMRADYFTEFYKKMELGQDKVITVTGLDGVVRARQEKDNLEDGPNEGQGELYRLTQSEAHGTFITPSAVDGIQRVQSYRVMPDYPIIVSVGMSREAAFAAYEKRKITYILGAAIVSLVIVSLCMLVIDRVEKALRKSKERYSSLMATMLDGFAYCKMIFENGQPQDIIYLEVNDAFEKLTGLKDVIGKKLTEVIPGIKESYSEVFTIYGRVSQSGKPERVELYVSPLQMWLSISVASTQKGYFIAIFDNITERKLMEEELNRHRDRLEILVEERSQELAMKNRE
ncbi:MAG: PAS domain S-box protein, partial [Sporomusaceae bacterium]|nr:PAS domain S-box protein [Sporomusaceae bacterium]